MECDKVQKTIVLFIDPAATEKPKPDDLDLAAGHISRCRTCRDATTPETRGRFISEYVLDRT